jgi:hypothetical protein
MYRQLLGSGQVGSAVRWGQQLQKQLSIAAEKQHGGCDSL